MRLNLLRLGVMLCGALALSVAYERTNSAAAMATAAKNFLTMLSPEQRARAAYGFEDKQRLDWHFIPRERKGLPLREMDAGQRAMAEALLSTGLSQSGFAKVSGVMSLEPVLRDMEKDTRGRRDAAGYFFTVFGEPSISSTWGWRFEGHHVALNFTVVKGQTVASSPSFLGSNPAELKDGPRKGFRALAGEEDLARQLLVALDDKQRAVAVVSPEAPKDIFTGNKLKAEPMESKGIAAGKLNGKQMALLMGVIEEYAASMPADIGGARLAAVRKAGVGKILFAWMGGADRGQPHYYRIQGPTFLIEYDNTQNNNNHSHSVWRDFAGDFGMNLLAAHYGQYHRQQGHGLEAGY